MYKGWTYTFDVSDASNGAHPLRFSSGGSAYNTGVTITGTQGQAGAKVQLVVPESQPTSFAYSVQTTVVWVTLLQLKMILLKQYLTI